MTDTHTKIGDAFCIFGNPIHHSQSPQIHALFSEETGIPLSYGRVLSDKNNFEQILIRFFEAGGVGANITLPFKEQAFSLCDNVTERASITGVVNTIKKQTTGSLLGDNTDGIGLISDLKRLSMLCQRSRVLLIGSGGAARGIIPSLLDYGCQITLTNRTLLRAEKLVRLYNNFGSIISLPMEKLHTKNYDLIINATSASIYGVVPPISNALIQPKVSCYDLFYHKQGGDTPFIAWCRQMGAGAEYCADGLGMLVGQAAHSFLLWHGILPPIVSILNKIRSSHLLEVEG